MDCGLGIKHRLGIKCRLRTEYKTRTRYKTWTTNYVYKNRSHSLYSPHVEKESKLHGHGRLCRYSRQLKLNSEFYQKKELEENQSEKH